MYLCQTKAGPVLVAINPFKEVLLYGKNYIEGYRRKSMDSPHVYAIADTAIREMIRGDFSKFLSGEPSAQINYSVWSYSTSLSNI